MLLNVSKRQSHKKRDAKRLRRESQIPAVLYGKSRGSDSVILDAGAFKAHLRKVPQGTLSTTVFQIQVDNGSTVKALIKDIQYHVVTYDILHVDFQELEAGRNIMVNVPVTCVNVVDCVGVKLGGMLRQMLRQIHLSCPSDQIPESFTIDVKDLQQGQSVKVSDLAVPKGVKILTPPGEVAVMIAKR